MFLKISIPNILNLLCYLSVIDKTRSLNLMVSYFDGVSVIIPTYNFKNILINTLESLCIQSLSKSKYEVIVVDDGSSDGTDQIIASFKSRIDISYIYQEDLGFRVATARNQGIWLAKYAVTLFFDAGMLASSVLLEQHYHAHKLKPNLALIGLSYGVNEYNSHNFSELSSLLQSATLEQVFSMLREREHLRDCRSNFLSQGTIEQGWVVFWTGNASVATDKLIYVNGFDEWFNSWGGEDVEVAIRLNKLGCTFEFLPSLEAIHSPHDKDEDGKKLTSKRNIKYICEKHVDPEYQHLIDKTWQDILLLHKDAESVC